MLVIVCALAMGLVTYGQAVTTHSRVETDLPPVVKHSYEDGSKQLSSITLTNVHQQVSDLMWNCILFISKYLSIKRISCLQIHFCAVLLNVRQT